MVNRAGGDYSGGSLGRAVLRLFSERNGVKRSDHGKRSMFFAFLCRTPHDLHPARLDS